MTKTRLLRAVVSGAVLLLIGAPATCHAEQFVLFDVTFNFTKEDADNSKPSKSHYYVKDKLINADRPKDWTNPVDYRNGTVHIRTEVLEKPAGSEPTTWSLCYIPNKGQKNGYGCTGTVIYRDKGVYEQDVSMTSFWQNDSIVWSEGIKQMDLVMKDNSGGNGHAHKRTDFEKFFPTKMRFTMIQVSAGATYDPNLVLGLPASKKDAANDKPKEGEKADHKAAGTDSNATTPGPAFADVTASSGVDAILDADYLVSPKLWLSGIDLVDLDGDGKLDLFLSAHSQKGAAAGLGDGKGRFTYVDPAKATLPPSEIHMAYDINEDGLLDFQMTYNDGGGKWWLNHSMVGQANFLATRLDLGGGQARQNAMIDIDRDGKIDWLHEMGRGLTTWDKGDGKGDLVQTKKPLLSTGWKDGPSMLPADLNGDGQVDMIMSMRGYEEEHTGRTRVFLNDGQMNFTESTKACGLSEGGLQIMGVGDFNRDGALDLICLENGKSVTVYINDGKANFTKLPDAVTGMEKATRPGDANWGLAVMTDLDNDGIGDVLMNGRSFLYVLRGTGGGHFTYMNKVWGIDDHSDAAVDAGLCFGDIDGDGALDILGFKRVRDRDQRRVKVYRNELPRQKWVNIRPVGLSGNKNAAGSKIRVYERGGLNDPQKLLAYEQVAIWARQVCHSYYSYTETERHFGLGTREAVDVSVEFYPSGKKVEAKGVQAGTTVSIQE